jgi:hypothetical protein
MNEIIKLGILEQIKASDSTPLSLSAGNAGIGIPHNCLKIPQGYSFGQFLSYILQLAEEGLLIYRVATKTQAGITAILIERLTYKGQTFLDENPR